MADYSDDFEESSQRGAVDPGIRDSRLSKQVSSLQRENAKLRRELTLLGETDRVNSLREEMVRKDNEIRALKGENRSLLKIQREQAKALTHLANDDEVPREIKRYGEEIRTLREQIRRYQERKRKDDEMLKAQHEKLIKVSDRCKMLVEQLKANNIDPQEQQDLLRIREEIERRKDTIAQLQKQVHVHQHAKEAESKKYRNQIGSVNKRCHELESEIDRLRKELENKDLELRSMALELKRAGVNPPGGRSSRTQDRPGVPLHPSHGGRHSRGSRSPSPRAGGGGPTHANHSARGNDTERSNVGASAVLRAAREETSASASASQRGTGASSATERQAPSVSSGTPRRLAPIGGGGAGKKSASAQHNSKQQPRQSHHGNNNRSGSQEREGAEGERESREPDTRTERQRRIAQRSEERAEAKRNAGKQPRQARVTAAARQSRQQQPAKSATIGEPDAGGARNNNNSSSSNNNNNNNAASKAKASHQQRQPTRPKEKRPAQQVRNGGAAQGKRGNVGQAGGQRQQAGQVGSTKRTVPVPPPATAPVDNNDEIEEQIEDAVEEEIIEDDDGVGVGAADPGGFGDEIDEDDDIVDEVGAQQPEQTEPDQAEQTENDDVAAEVDDDTVVTDEPPAAASGQKPTGFVSRIPRQSAPQPESTSSPTAPVATDEANAVTESTGGATGAVDVDPSPNPDAKPDATPDVKPDSSDRRPDSAGDGDAQLWGGDDPIETSAIVDNDNDNDDDDPFGVVGGGGAGALSSADDFDDAGVDDMYGSPRNGADAGADVVPINDMHPAEEEEEQVVEEIEAPRAKEATDGKDGGEETPSSSSAAAKPPADEFAYVPSFSEPSQPRAPMPLAPFGRRKKKW